MAEFGERRKRSALAARVGEEPLRRWPEPDEHLGGRLGQPLAGAQVPRHAPPAPGVDEEPHGTERLHVGVPRHVALLAIARVLAAYQVGGRERSHGLEDGGLLAVHGGEAPGGRWLHGQQGDDLEEMILDHVAQAARRFVERAAAPYPEVLREGHLDAGHVVAVPDGLEERVGEPEVEDVHDRFLAEEVIDAEDGVLGKHRPRHAVQLARGGEVAAEGLLDDDARVVREARRRAVNVPGS